MSLNDWLPREEELRRQPKNTGLSRQQIKAQEWELRQQRKLAQPGATPMVTGIAGGVPDWRTTAKRPGEWGNVSMGEAYWKGAESMPAGATPTAWYNGVPVSWRTPQQGYGQGVGGGPGGGGLGDLLYSRGMAQISGDLGRRGLMSSSIYGQASARMAAESQLAEYQYGLQAQQQAFSQNLQTQQLGLQRQQLSQQWGMFMGQLEANDYWRYMDTYSRYAPTGRPPTLNMQVGGRQGNQTYPVMGGGRVGGGIEYGSAADMAAGGYRPPSNQTDWRGLNEGLQRAEDEYWNRQGTTVRW